MGAPENPPAFPDSGWGKGMTLRDWFAGQAAPAAISLAMEFSGKEASPMPQAARFAYEFADAMLAERAKS